jgi:DNA-directed RNA polymerase subunit E'
LFYTVKVKDHIRVPPRDFDKDLEQAVISRIKEKYGGYISKDLGFVIDVSDVEEIGEGVLIPEDGASYYLTTFELLAFEPKMQEVILGKVRDVADFGAFVNIGPVDGMMHISQAMNDYVSVTDDDTLQGKESNKVLKVGDHCRARIVAVSYKDPTNPKIGLTMRQEGLGKPEWVESENGDES